MIRDHIQLNKNMIKNSYFAKYFNESNYLEVNTYK